MKIDRIDVAHEEIAERCDEYIVISCEFPDDSDNYISRANVRTNGDILKEIIVNEMFNNKKFAKFVQTTVKEYNQQKREI
jgi:hypothetical protein